MVDAGTSLSFFCVAVLLAISPGPDNLFVLANSALRGRRAGMYVVLGLCGGLLVQTAAVAVGLSALFAASSFAFAVLKGIGATYLCYLAWQVWRAPPAEIGGSAESGFSTTRMFGRGMLMNLSNPKVVMFFLAFLPQFTEPARGHLAAQLIWLGLLFIFATLLVFGSIAHYAATLGRHLRQSPRLLKLLNRSAAVVFVALALRLATANP
jgi:threonine/homoserine/homoserine lactone efflux protein